MIYRNPKNGLLGTSRQWAERTGASSASTWYKRFHRLKDKLQINNKEAETDLRMLPAFKNGPRKKGRPKSRKSKRRSSVPTAEWLALGNTPRRQIID